MGGTLIGVGVTASSGDRSGVDAVATPERLRNWFDDFVDVCVKSAGDELRLERM